MPTKLNRLLKKLNARKLHPGSGRPVRTRSPKPVQNAEQRLGEHAITALLDAYETGATVADLMTAYDLGKGTVLGILRRHAIKLRNQGLPAADLREAAKLYGAGWSLQRIGQRFGCDAATVRKRLAEHGVTIRRRNGY